MNSLNNQNHKEQFDIYELMITPPNKKAEMIISEVVKDNPDISLIKTLIHIGANMDWHDESGRTPLHWKPASASAAPCWKRHSCSSTRNARGAQPLRRN